jgi:hypothetical protein
MNDNFNQHCRRRVHTRPPGEHFGGVGWRSGTIGGFVRRQVSHV